MQLLEKSIRPTTRYEAGLYEFLCNNLMLSLLFYGRLLCCCQGDAELFLLCIFYLAFQLLRCKATF